MIKIGKYKNRVVHILEFGYGDIHPMGFNDGETVGVCFYNVSQGEIGRSLKIPNRKQAKRIFEKKADVYMSFKNIESLDVTINNLKSIRKIFIDNTENK